MGPALNLFPLILTTYKSVQNLIVAIIVVARYLRTVVHSHLYNVLHYNVTIVTRKHYWLYGNPSRMVPDKHCGSGMT